MFYSCNSLNSLPDISKWNTNNVNNMSYMFSYCKSLNSLPDISKWNTNNVNNMRGMFSGCKSLNSLPDISKWNMNNVNDMSCMFSGCKSLNSLPDISKWDFSNTVNFENIFSECSDKINSPILPDIKLYLFGGYMFENQFSKFLDNFKDLLYKKEKSENIFEIKSIIKDLDGFNLQISSIKNINFEKTFEVSKENYEKFEWIFTLKLEVKNEVKKLCELWEKFLYPMINSIPNIKNNGYDIKFRELKNNIYLDLVSKKNEAFKKFKRILDCFFNYLEFDFIIKSGIDAILLLNENLNDETIDKILSFLITLKSSENIYYILNSLYKAFKDVKFNNNNLQKFYDLIIKKIENKNSVEIFAFILEIIIEIKKKEFGDKFKEEFKKEFGEEFEEELGEEFKEKFKEKIKNELLELLKAGFKTKNPILALRDIIISIAKLLDSFGLKEHFLLLNLDDIKFLFYRQENKNGFEVNLKLKNITKVLAELLK